MDQSPMNCSGSWCEHWKTCTHTHTRDGDDHHNASIFQLKRGEAKDLMNLLCKLNQKNYKKKIKKEHKR